MRMLLVSAALALACNKSVDAPSPAPSVHALTVQTIDGVDKPLADYAGKVLLIVNVASKCGFTPQYESLEALHERYAPRGLRVLGFPANDFGGQEPGTNAEIKSFCSGTYGVGFDMFAKVGVTTTAPSPLFTLLTDARSPYGGPVQWNFTKFLIDKDGRVVARFEPSTSPLAAEVVAAVERQLAL